MGRALLLISICTHMTVARLKYECVPFMEKANRCLLFDNLECRGDQGENSQKLLKGTCLSGRDRHLRGTWVAQSLERPSLAEVMILGS